jgi:hypothetical protein
MPDNTKKHKFYNVQHNLVEALHNPCAFKGVNTLIATTQILASLMLPLIAYNSFTNNANYRNCDFTTVHCAASLNLVHVVSVIVVSMI